MLKGMSHEIVLGHASAYFMRNEPFANAAPHAHIFTVKTEAIRSCEISVLTSLRGDTS
jgi:hypothetical protein